MKQNEEHIGVERIPREMHSGYFVGEVHTGHWLDIGEDIDTGLRGGGQKGVGVRGEEEEEENIENQGALDADSLGNLASNGLEQPDAPSLQRSAYYHKQGGEKRGDINSYGVAPGAGDSPNCIRLWNPGKYAILRMTLTSEGLW